MLFYERCDRCYVAGTEATCTGSNDPTSMSKVVTAAAAATADDEQDAVVAKADDTAAEEEKHGGVDDKPGAV